MRIPTDIVFENSYVLDLKVRPYAVELPMDFVLTPEHTLFHPPRFDEWACFRRGTLRIVGFSAFAWSSRGARPAIDATGERDYGCLDELSGSDGSGWKLAGDWGSIEVTGGTLEIDLSSDN